MKPFYIVTTRFTNKTWKENKQWRERNKWKGCIYGVPSIISTYSKIPNEALIYVIEMNNDTNQIMGIGALKNKANFMVRPRIYKEHGYNLYIYRDKYAHITREKLVAHNKFYKIFVDYLEEIVFCGKSHMKRGQGFTSIKIKWKKKNNKLISLPIAPRYFSYFIKKFAALSKKERLARLERIQHHILNGCYYLFKKGGSGPRLV